MEILLNACSDSLTGTDSSRYGANVFADRGPDGADPTIPVFNPVAGRSLANHSSGDGAVVDRRDTISNATSGRIAQDPQILAIHTIRLELGFSVVFRHTVFS